jgi:hypothetical protein
LDWVVDHVEIVDEEGQPIDRDLLLSQPESDQAESDQAQSDQAQSEATAPEAAAAEDTTESAVENKEA